MTKIILLDSNSLINRAYYALPPLENKQGVVTNAIFGYLSMLARLICRCLRALSRTRRLRISVRYSI